VPPPLSRALCLWSPSCLGLWGLRLGLAGVLGLALPLVGAAPHARADEPPPALRAELEAWIATIDAPLARDSESLLRWRRVVPDLEHELARAAKGPAPLGPRALGVWAALATKPDPFPAGPLRERVARRAGLLARLASGTLGPTEAARLDAAAGESLRELGGDPLGGPWREAALHALGGRPDARGTLRRVAAAGGAGAGPARLALVSLKDVPGLFLALDAALDRGAAGEAKRCLEDVTRLEKTRPLERVRRVLRGDAPLRHSATLARAVGALGWRDLQGALRRLLREQSLAGAARVGVSAAFLRLGGQGRELDQALLSELCAACLEPGPLGREAFAGLATLPPALAAGALGLELRRPDPEGARRARAVHAAEALSLTQLAGPLRILARDATQPHLTRAAAVHALGTFGGPDDQKVLVLLGRDASPGLRRAALEGLVRMPRRARVSAVSRALSEALVDQEPALRLIALRALERPSDLAILRAALAKAWPSLVSPEEVQTWLERATRLSLVDAKPALWLLTRWESRSELRGSLALARATLAYARTLPAALTVPVLLDLLQHQEQEVKRAAHDELTRRYPSGESFAGDQARWSRAWRGHPALFR
jgi:hypothetical protein